MVLCAIRPQVESNDGLVLASFAKHTSALRWAVQCIQQMHKIHWYESSIMCSACSACTRYTRKKVAHMCSACTADAQDLLVRE
eukprot:1139425-Pelagomonas_calceolata.AAC.1